MSTALQMIYDKLHGRRAQHLLRAYHYAEETLR